MTRPHPTPEQLLFGSKLRAGRLKAGLSQTELAIKIRSTQHYVSCAERGLENPPLLTLVRFAEAVGGILVIDIKFVAAPKR